MTSTTLSSSRDFLHPTSRWSTRFCFCLQLTELNSTGMSGDERFTKFPNSQYHPGLLNSSVSIQRRHTFHKVKLRLNFTLTNTHKRGYNVFVCINLDLLYQIVVLYGTLRLRVFLFFYSGRRVELCQKESRSLLTSKTDEKVSRPF